MPLQGIESWSFIGEFSWDAVCSDLIIDRLVIKLESSIIQGIQSYRSVRRGQLLEIFDCHLARSELEIIYDLIGK